MEKQIDKLTIELLTLRKEQNKKVQEATAQINYQMGLRDGIEAAIEAIEKLGKEEMS